MIIAGMVSAPIAALCLGVTPGTTERVERFDKDPHWDGRNNRPSRAIARTIRQDFGYSRSNHAGGRAAEVGGLITPAGEPAYYAKRIPERTLKDSLSASGTVTLGRKTHVLIGFLNNLTVNEWRTPNSIAIRLQGRGDYLYAYVEYATSKWRAGADSPGGFSTVRDPVSGRMQLKGFDNHPVYRWSLEYDPDGNHGGGSIRVTLGDETAICNLDPTHKADGAAFNRFGLLNIVKSADDGGEIWLNDLTINREQQDLSRDPGWEGFRNRRTYQTTDIRPHGEFGYSRTSFAGGQSGELGGLVFRGDCRYPESMGCYGDRLSTLTLEKPLKASGKVSLRRGVSDSATLIGFYHSGDSMTVSDSQTTILPRSFLGIEIEGPSREGFLFYPVYRVNGEEQGISTGEGQPHILPDGSKHAWSLSYSPDDAARNGRMTLKFDDRVVTLALGPGHKSLGTRFDRFGIITTWIDGNGQRIYFDDLMYTVTQP